MRSLAVGLIFSILFASLPAKVWACGLNLCPMDHPPEFQSDEKAMPCHQVNDREESREALSDSTGTNDQFIKVNQIACPCPETYLDSAFIVEIRKQLELEQLSLPNAVVFNVATIKSSSDPVFRYRPPPLRGSARIQIIFQVFII